MRTCTVAAVLGPALCLCCLLRLLEGLDIVNYFQPSAAAYPKQLQRTALHQQQQQREGCPFHYERPSLAEIKVQRNRSYLFGGIVHHDDGPTNTSRKWSRFCSFQETGSQQFNNWLCDASQVASVINRTLQQNDAQLLQMTPCDLWPWLRGRTLWLVGDSMPKELYKALRCFMIEFLIAPDLLPRPPTHNITIMQRLDDVQPPYKDTHLCDHLLDGTRICSMHAVLGQIMIAGNGSTAPVLPLILDALARPHDIFILNFGLWHGPSNYAENLHKLGRYYSSVKAKFPNMFWMETPKQHFDSEDGDFRSEWKEVRKGPWVCQPVKGVSMNADNALTAEPGDAVGQYVVNGSWRNINAREILQQQYGMGLLAIYNITATAWDLHMRNHEGQECSHFCHPALPQLWLWVLKQTLSNHVAPHRPSQVEMHGQPSMEPDG